MHDSEGHQYKCMKDKYWCNIVCDECLHMYKTSTDFTVLCVAKDFTANNAKLRDWQWCGGF